MQIDRRSRKKTPEESLRISVDALGGLQEVGSLLRPEMDPIAAGQWLSHCLNPAKRDKLSEEQKHLIWRRCFSMGAHEGFQAYAESIGYAADPKAADALLVESVKRAEFARAQADDAARDLRTLIEQPELLARMQAAGLNVESIA